MHISMKGGDTMGKFWEIKNDAGADAELLLYGAISDRSWSSDDVTPRLFAEDLRALGGKSLTVRINSPGGDVFAAQSIYNQLRTYGGRVTVRIDGLAASAATIVACAGDTVIMPTNALYMIHNPATVTVGDAAEMRTAADVLDTVRETIVNVYQKRTGDQLTAEELTAMMDDETWMTAQEALAYGFVDQIDEQSTVTNCVKDGLLIVNSVSCDLGKFRHADKVRELLNRKDSVIPMGENTGGNDLLNKIKDLLGGTAKEQADGGPAPTSSADDAVQAERQRLLALDALDDRTNAAVTKIVNLAKENGSTAAEVQPYVDAVKDAVETRNVADEIRKLIEDHLNSGASAVAPSPQPQPKDKVEQTQADIDEVVAIANKNRG
jgi:ATP-dependent Clp protease, proteolytic subunit ClpP